MSRLYSEEIKEKFLSTYDNIQTQKTIRNVFQNTCDVEDTFDKDLYDFTLDQIGKVIKNYIKPHTVSVAKSNGRFISQYISWAIGEGFRKSNLNPLKGAENDFYEDLVDKTRKVHHSYDEFLTLLEDKLLYNSQDKSLLFMMWHGILGERFSQLREIKFSDIDFENKTVYVRERDYHVPVDDKCIEYLEKTRSEDTYYQYNSSTGEFSEKLLLESPYVFRNVKSPRGLPNEPLKINVFYSRIQTLKELLNLEFLSPQSLRQSGMIHEAYKQYQKDGEIGYEQLAKVGDKYQYSMITNNNHTYYNTFLMREFLSSDNLLDLYGIDLEIEKR